MSDLYLNFEHPTRRGTDASRMIFRMTVGPALRNQGMVWRLSHSCAPSELAVGFWCMRVPSGHGAVQSYVLYGSDWCSAMGGCVATARHHSLRCLPRLLVNYNKLLVPRSGTYIMKPTASCEAAPLWVRAIVPPHIVPWRGTDASTMMLRMVVGPASRNQVRVGRIIPQLRSFGACSGFLMYTCPLGTRRW